MSMSWGGFGNGLAQGLALGDRIGQEIDEARLARVRAQGIAEARALQEKVAPKVTDLGDEQNLTSNPQMSRDPNAAPEPVNTSLANVGRQAQPEASPDAVRTSPVAPPQVQDTSALSSTPLASAAPGAKLPDPDAPPSFATGLPAQKPKRFQVDGQGFDTQEEAAAYVKKAAPKLESFYAQTLVPRMRDKLIEMGRPDQAAAWEKYADEAQTKTNMTTWGKAIKLAQFGDFTGSAQELMKLHPHFDDGFDLIHAEPTKGPDGADGFTMTVRGEDGKEQQIYHDAKTITEVGLAQLSPIEMFNKRFARQTQADTLQAKEVIDQANDERTRKRVLDNTAQRDKDAMARQEAADKAKRERQDADNAAKMERARQGWAAAAKRDADRIASQGAYRKSVSPEERQAIIVTALSKDAMFNMLSPEEKQQRVQDTMALIPATPARANPQQQGLPTSAAPTSTTPPAGSKFRFNPATGLVETVVR